jgi:hypothetical protein
MQNATIAPWSILDPMDGETDPTSILSSFLIAGLFGENML